MSLPRYIVDIVPTIKATCGCAWLVTGEQVMFCPLHLKEPFQMKLMEQK